MNRREGYLEELGVELLDEGVAGLADDELLAIGDFGEEVFDFVEGLLDEGVGTT